MLPGGEVPAPKVAKVFVQIGQVDRIGQGEGALMAFDGERLKQVFVVIRKGKLRVVLHPFPQIVHQVGGEIVLLGKSAGVHQKIRPLSAQELRGHPLYKIVPVLAALAGRGKPHLDVDGDIRVGRLVFSRKAVQLGVVVGNEDRQLLLGLARTGLRTAGRSVGRAWL